MIAARIFLGERLPSTFFLTLIITVSGLIFICQPTFIFGGGDAISWQGVAFLIGTVIAWSGACVLVRTAKKANWLQLEITATTQSLLLWCPLVIILNRFWLHSDGLSGGDWDWSLETGIYSASFFLVFCVCEYKIQNVIYINMTGIVMGIIGVLGFLALMLNVIGYQIGDATKVAWMEYLDLVFAFLYQWLYFGDIPTNWEIIGCCMLLSTCLIHLGEEYYHYVQAKKSKDKHDKKEMEHIMKAKEGTIDFRRLSDESQSDYDEMNEMQPLLTDGINGKDSKVMGLLNKINVFRNSDYTQIDNKQ